MKLAAEDFARITAACARIADERHAVPAFRNAHLAASDGMLTAMASNGEYWLTLRAPCDGDLAPVLAPAGKLADAVGKLVADNVDVSLDGAALHIKAKGSKRKLQVTTSDTFPQPDIDDGTMLAVDVARLLECFAFCVPFANDDQTQPSLNGVHISVRDGQLRCAATDGNAVVECVYGEAAGFEPATVPTGFATEVGKLGIATDASLVFSERKVRIEWAEGRLIAPRVTGAFPQYERIIPGSPTASAELPADDIARSCAGVRPFGTHVGKFGTVLAITSEYAGIQLMARTGEGEAIDTLNASLNGDIPVFGLSSAYLEKACKGFGNAKVRIKVTSETSPVLIDSEEKTDRLAVIMPRRI